MFPRKFLFVVVSCLLLSVGVVVLLFAANPKLAKAESLGAPETMSDAFGGEQKFQESICLTDEKRAEIQEQLQLSINKLRAEDKIAAIDSSLPPQFIFPVRGNAAAVTDFGVHRMVNFVDHNPAFPSQVRDYYCGTRTYDNSNGYNHKGIDIANYPFSWNKMDNNETIAVAAADGQIIFKSDGNFDRSCTFNNNSWNAVYLRHADGTVSWYGHLKRSSLTTKAVGQSVAQGEYLGVVGSSGNSTGPHLHFEIYNASNQLQDPYQGTCNLMNSFSYWLIQPAYRDSSINKLMTHSAPPVFQSCPNPDIPNEKNVFTPGSQVIVAAYYRDQVVGQESQLFLIQPDGTVYQSWTHVSPNTYTSSYWYFTRNLPANASIGTWKFRVVYESKTYEHTFLVRAAQLFDFDGDEKADVSVFRPENGVWYLNQSTNGFTGLAFGFGTDKIVPADYDGDGKTDVAVYRNGTWFLQRSRDGFLGIAFGATTDIPMPADFTGDGRAEIAVFRPSDGGWYIYNLINNQFTAIQFGQAEDVPVAADYDGDGKADVAVFRNGTWYLLRSRDGFTGVAFGQSGDKPVPAEYDGDGKADIAVFRPSNGTWYLQQSTAGFTGVQFGISSDKPAPADYDGDGKADIAVFRDGTWYLQRSGQGFTGVAFGAATDKPIPAAFVQ